MSIENPCIFKGVCKTCIAVEVDNRPIGCEKIKCQHLTPCKKCGMNMRLDAGMLCKNCNGTPKQTAERVKSYGSGVAKVAGLDVSVTVPGEAPPELSEEEKTYYNNRWNDYKGYYRDPAAFYICHCMILEEMNLTSINSMLLRTRGERNIEYEKAKAVSVNTLKKLKEQLPEKEAQEATDDEKSLAGIHDAWLKAKGERARQGISRVFTEEAIALAPELPHKLNLRRMLLACGFEVIEIEDALKKVKTDFKTPLELLKYLGLRVDEKYAMPEEGFEEVEADDEYSRKPIIDIADESEEK